jgi:hypothetical protein
MTTSVVPIYMYFLATCITVQSYPSFDLVLSPQVLFPFTCISLPHVLQFSHLWWLDQIKTRIGLNCNIYGQEIHVNGATLVVIGPNENPQFLVHLHVLQFSPILVLIWSNHHKCSIYMYFLVTCITVQSYLIFELVQSPQVLIHLHVFPGHMWWLDQIKTRIGLNCNTWIWSNHHKCSIYMYFLVTCITVQSYLIFELVQSPQVLFHLHVFPLG